MPDNQGCIMAEGGFYNRVGLLEEAQRYRTSVGFLDLLYRELNGSKRLLNDGTGPRLLTVTSALADELYSVDIYQGSIDRAREFVASWRQYINQEPFKTEFDFLQRKNLTPNFGNCHFYLKRNFPSNLRNSFDGELASELFLHLDMDEIRQILEKATSNLNANGRFIFTVYPSGHPDSLDERFCELGSRVGMEKDDFIRDGVVDIRALAEQLRKHDDIYRKEKDRYWLDLEKVRVFSAEEIEGLCKDSGFHIRSKSNLNGGMFSFACRLVYVLTK